MAMPTDRHLSWVTSVMGPDAAVEQVTALHGDQSPWLMTIRLPDELVQVILRVADGRRVWAPAIATAAAALQVAGAHGVPTARLIAADLDGSATGAASLIETYCPGTSTPPEPVPGALRSAGAALAALHTIALPASPQLPERTHHTPPDDHPGDRRWSFRYQQAPESQRPSILAEFLKQHSWMSPDRALDRLENTPVTALLLDAEERIGDHRPPQLCDVHVFLHADVWFGNTLWSGNRCLGLIDWKAAGVGHPGVDLGSLRLNTAMIYGLPAADDITHGWEETTGREAEAVPYWDAIAALYTPAEVGVLPFPAAGGKELPTAEFGRRRDAFLLDALERLD